MPDIENHRPHRKFRGRAAAAAAGIALLVAGGGVGAIAMQATRPSVTMAPAIPIAIGALTPSDGIVTIKGRVAEIFGNKFIVQDASGRALVDTGREGEGGTLIVAGAPVTVQGRFDRGFVHAAFLVGADNKAIALGPLGPDHHGPRHGPEGAPDDVPPPPGSDRHDPSPPPPPAVDPAAVTAAQH